MEYVSIFRSSVAALRIDSVINLFYLPGSFLGAFLSDWIGPRYCLALGVLLQGIVGFIMSGLYGHLNQPSQVGGFVGKQGSFHLYHL